MITLPRTFFGLPLEQIRPVLDELPIGISYYDRDLRYQFINKTYKEWFHVSDSLIGQRLPEVYSRIFGTPFTETELNFRRALEGKALTKERRFIVGNETRDFRISYVPNVSASGEVVGLIGILHETTERTRAQVALNATVRRERALLDAIPEPAFMKDVEGRYIAVNATLCSLIHRQRNEILGKTDRELFEPPCCEKFRENDRMVLEAKKTLRFEEELSVPNQGSVWFETVKTPHLGSDGEVACIVGVSRDITDAHKQKLNERQYLHRLEALDQISQIISATKDNEELITKIIEAVYSIFNADRAWLMLPADPDAPGWKVPFQTTRPEYPPGYPKDTDLPMNPVLREMLRESLAAQEPLSLLPLRDERTSQIKTIYKQFSILSQLTIVVRPKLGPAWLLGLHQCSHERIWSDHEKSLFKEISYRLADALTTLNLFKDLQSSNAAFRESEANFRALAENAKIGILVVTPGGPPVYANQHAAELLGCSSPEQLVGTSIADFISPKDAAMLLYRLDRRIQGLPIPPSFEIEIHRKDGSVVPVEVTGTRTVWRGHPVDLVLGRDITERKRSEKERAELLVRAEEARKDAERANHAKDIFLATLSHELRTPLTSILTWAQLLNSGKVNSERAQHGIQLIEKAARTQAQLINDLLDISRIIMGKLRVELNPTDPIAIIKATIDHLGPTIAERSIALETAFESATLKVWADSARLQQILSNLLHNAIKFTPEGGRIRLELRQEGQSAVFKVQDWGKGIPPAFLPHIFNRFSQADPSVTRSHGGLGLGLAIVRHMVELHGGSISAHSDGPGHGSQFTFTLPVAATELPEVSGELDGSKRLPTEGTSPLEGIKLLLVEDDQNSRLALETMLQTFGAEVVTASSASEALAKLPITLPEIILSDIGMPEEDGFSLLRKIRALPSEQGGATPAIALTAFATRDDQERAFNAGFCSHISKPADSALLISHIRAFAIRRPRITV